MSQYSKGANFERLAQKFLEDEGAFVIRSAGSHSPVDLIALWNEDCPWLIQCKLDGSLSAKEAQTLTILAGDKSCKAFMATKQGKDIVWVRYA